MQDREEESYRLLIKLMDEFEEKQKYYLRTTRYLYFKEWVLGKMGKREVSEDGMEGNRPDKIRDLGVEVVRAKEIGTSKDRYQFCKY